MARRAKVSYWASRGGYCCWIQGKQRLLASGPKDDPDGPIYLEALERFKSLFRLAQAPSRGDVNTVGTICTLYLNHISTRRKARTILVREPHLRHFCESFGDVRCLDLKPFMIDQYTDQRRTKPRQINRLRGSCVWGDGTVRVFLTSLQAAFSWAVRAGLMTVNPVRNVEFPAPRKRQVVLTPEQHQSILDSCGRALRPVIVVLEATGCRPGELVQARPVDFDPELKALVFKAEDRKGLDEPGHKTGRYSKDRTIYLHGVALDKVRQLLEMRHPTSPLFVRHSRDPVTDRTRGHTLQSIGQGFRYLRDRLGITGLTPYAYRHTFATRWLMEGRPVEILAELLGNTPQVIYRHYSHLLGQHQTIRGHLESFRSSADENNPRRLTDRKDV